MSRKAYLGAAVALILAGDLIGGWVLYTLMTLVHFLLVMGIMVGVPVLLLAGPPVTRRAIEGHRQKKTAEHEMERTRLQAMSFLTKVDEVWLAERHHWSPPMEVSRIRAGQPWDQPWHWERKPIEVQNREELERRALRAKQLFEGDNLGAEEVRLDAIEGEIM